MSDSWTSPDGTIRLLCGDCLEVMQGMEAASVEAIVCDPPYGLSDHKPEHVEACMRAWLDGREYVHGKRGFMGRTWDGWVPGPEVWRECYRVLKPGGYLLAFAGSRTSDLMGMALRLAG
jgi:site-specific DNA-methyltransferase (adenine-specific)